MVSRTATIPKKVSGGDELIVIKRSDFEVFNKWQAEVGDALAKVRRGQEEYKNKKTITASSPRKFRR